MFPGQTVGCRVDRLPRGDQVLIAAISGPTPKIVIIRFRVVSQDVKADLGSDLVEGPGQEVSSAHPGLEGPERVFDGRSSHAHGLGHAVEPGLRPVEHVLILPALVMRRSLVGVHCGLSGQVKQALRWRSGRSLRCDRRGDGPW